MGASLSNELKCDVQIMSGLCFFAISFVLQRQAMLDGLEPLSYNAVRYAVSTLVMCCLKYVVRFEVRSEDAACDVDHQRSPNHLLLTTEGNKVGYPLRNLWLWALYLGLGHFGGSVLQQIGLVTVTAGKTGFITGMYVIFVPVAEFVLPHYQTTMSWLVWVAALTSLVGLYLLSGCAEQHVCFGGAIGEGEMLVFISMLFWVTNIIVADICAKEMEIVFLQLLEFLIVTVLTALLVLAVQPFGMNLQLLTQHWLSIVAVGITEAVGFTLSTMGQIYSTPSHAAVLYSLEAVVCALFSYIFLAETLTAIELSGAALMFIAALISSYSASPAEVLVDGSSSHSRGEDSEPIFANNVNFGSIELSSKQPNLF